MTDAVEREADEIYRRCSERVHLMLVYLTIGTSVTGSIMVTQMQDSNNGIVPPSAIAWVVLQVLTVIALIMLKGNDDATES